MGYPRLPGAIPAQLAEKRTDGNRGDEGLRPVRQEGERPKRHRIEDLPWGTFPTCRYWLARWKRAPRPLLQPLLEPVQGRLPLLRGDGVARPLRHHDLQLVARPRLFVR